MNNNENGCQSIFMHEHPEEISKAFTELWVQLINEREKAENIILQANVAGL